MSLTGQTGVTMGTVAGAAVNATAGTVAGNATSTNMADYTYAAITSPASVLITSNTGDVILNDNVNLSARGNSVGVTAANDINIGANDTFFAQGGNVWFDATNNFSLPAAANAQMTAVARTTTGTIVIGGETVPDFTGGGVAIYAGNPGLNLDNVLRAAQLARVPAGTTVIDPGVNIAGTTLNLTNGGTISLTAPGAGKIGAINSIFNVNGGVLLIDPPGDQIDINNLLLGVTGQSLTVIPPIPPTPSPVIVLPEVAASVSAVAISATPTPSSSSVIIPTDVISMGSSEDEAESPNPFNTTETIKSGSNVFDASMRLFIISNGICQPFVFGNDEDGAIIGQGGAMFAPLAANSVELKEGKIIAVAGKKDMIVETAQGRVVVPAQTASIIEQSVSGTLRVATLDGGVASVEMNRDNALAGAVTKGSVDGSVTNPANKGMLVVQANPGEELVIADDTLSDEELIPVDGVDREPIEGALTIPGHSIAKRRYDRPKMAERDALLLCNLGGSRQQIQKKISQIRQKMLQQEALAPQPVKGPNAQGPISFNKQLDYGKILAPGLGQHKEQAGKLTPIAFTLSGPAALLNNGLCALELSGSSIRHTAHAKLKVEGENAYNLISGEMLVVADKPTTISSGVYKIMVTPGTVALISSSKSIFKLANLFESKGGSIRFVADKNSIDISAGQDLIIASDDSSLTHALRSETVGRRRQRGFELNNSRSVMRSEVSLVSLLQNNEVLSKLLKSTSLVDQKLCERLIKMAACLNQVTVSHGAYSTLNNGH
jgi:hypothetical protein